MSRISFTVPGPPVPKGRPRVTSRGTFTPARTRAYEKHVKACAMEARTAQDTDEWKRWPTEKRCRLEVGIVVGHRRRVDCDNYLKAAADALIGVIFRDDSQVDSVFVERFYTHGETYMTVAVQELGDEMEEL